MKADDLKTKTSDELKKILVDLKKQQFNLRFQKSQNQLANSSLIRSVRRDVARVKTFLTIGPAVAAGEKAAKPKKAPAAKKPSKKTAA